MARPVDKNSPLYKLRHSLAHIMAQSVLKIRPDAKLGFGPPVDNGFYYDFDFGDQPITEDDLKTVTKGMFRIVNEKQPFENSMLSLDEAEKILGGSQQSYKIEYARELVESGKSDNGKLGFYQNGPFLDMCEGPHLEHTGQVPRGIFKLDKIAGSYWRGDEKRPQLTRIYGLAFETPEDLKDYIERRKLAMQRDHRKLGAKLDIFFIDDEVGTGLPMWMPNGTVIRDALEEWAREQEFIADYQRVSTPAITRSNLYYKSGHLPYYDGGMYPPMIIDEHDEYYLRPMNCPHHHKIYEARPRSYRDLPLRLSEYGDTYRYEKHGSLSGLLRVRAMCMNDAHIYCEPEQVAVEFRKVIEMYSHYYQHLRIGDFRVRLSLHSADKEKFVENEADWIKSEEMVRNVLDEMKIEYEEEIGEAAFYGPKIDIQLENLLGREETVSTCQLDFVMAERFGLTYTASDGSQQRPYIIHRAPLGTHERFVSFLIEFYGGAFPTWMAPTQVQIVPVSDEVTDYVKELATALKSSFFRVIVDDSQNSFNKKIRNAVTAKIPNIWIIGNKEAEERQITWRRYAAEAQHTIDFNKAIEALKMMHQKRMMDNFSDVELPLV